jgi:tetratricopeptide (TPR) repeat protein
VADRNPYVIGVPLTDDAGFYGRQDFFAFITDVLNAAKQNVIVLYGQRRIGKTSVLHRAAGWLEEHGPFFPVYYDLQGKERQSLSEVLENLAQVLARRIDLPKPDAKLFDDAGRFFAKPFLPRVFQRLKDKRLVLLVDEFDVLSDELENPRSASTTLFPYLQELIATQPQIGFVFVVGRRIDELATHFQAILKQAVYRRVGHLRPEESRALIVEPVSGALTYEDAAIRRIQSVAAGHPYFTQLICFEIFNAACASGKKTVTADAVDLSIGRAIESGHGALNWFWEGLPRAERFILSAVAEATDEKGVASKEAIRGLLEEHRILLNGLELKDAPDRLVEWEMLRREGADAYQFVVEIVRRWVSQEHPLSSARRDIDYVSKRAVRLFENARDAHSEGDLPYARDEYSRTLNANPNHSGAQLGLALVLFELGEIDEAIVQFERAYAIDEMSARDGLVRARLTKAKALEEEGNVAEAAFQYEQVLHVSTADETSANRLAAICVRRAEDFIRIGDLQRAVEMYRKALLYDHGHEARGRALIVLLDYATYLEQKQDVITAAHTYIIVAQLLDAEKVVRPHAVAFTERAGNKLIAEDRLDYALKLYQEMMAAFPEDSTLTYALRTAETKVDERNTMDRIFKAASSAHSSGDFQSAVNGYVQLVEREVFRYRGTNIATLLAAAIDGVPPPPTSGKPNKVAASVQPAGMPTRELQIAPRTRRRIFLWCTVIGTAWLAVFFFAPPSILRITLAQPPPLKAGMPPISLQPVAYYNDSWGRSRTTISAKDYTWITSNDAVATVSEGRVKGVGPGEAIITAGYGGVSGMTKVNVTHWDVIAMKANVTAVRFFQSSYAEIPNAELRTYEQRFAWRKGLFIFAELSLDIDETASDRSVVTTIYYKIYQASGRVAESASWPVQVEQNWSEVKTPVRLDFSRGVLTTSGTPGKYRVFFFDEEEGGNKIAEGAFEVY